MVSFKDVKFKVAFSTFIDPLTDAISGCKVRLKTAVYMPGFKSTVQPSPVNERYVPINLLF